MITNNLDKSIDNLFKRAVEKFGSPPAPGIPPTLEQIFDMYIFYNENNESIRMSNNDIEMQLSSYISDKMNQIIASANYYYKLDPIQFSGQLNAYIESNKNKSIFKNFYKKIYGDTKHCGICGDTEQYSNLTEIKSMKIMLCEDCIKIQKINL